MVERTIRTMHRYVKRIYSRESWIVTMRRVEDAYNDSWHSVVKATPREVFLGEKKGGR